MFWLPSKNFSSPFCFRLIDLPQTQAPSFALISSKANWWVPFQRRAPGGSGSSIMLLIITGSNCTSTLGYSEKLINAGQQWSHILTPSHRAGTHKFLCRPLCGMSLTSFLFVISDSWTVVAAVKAGAHFELPSCNSWVLQASHLFIHFSFSLGSQLPLGITCCLVQSGDVLHLQWNPVR